MVDLSRTEYPRCAVLLMRISIRRLSTGFIRSSRPSSSRSDVTLRCSGHRRLALIDCTASSNWPAWTRANSISADRLYRFVELARLDTRRCRVSHGSRSEEHTSELQSPCNLVCRLLL